MKVRGDRGSAPLSQVEFDQIKEAWVTAKPSKQPTLRVDVTVCSTEYQRLRLALKPKGGVRTARSMDALADKGAQVCVAGMELVHSMGFKRKDLIKVKMELQAAHKSDMEVLGAVLMEVSPKSGGTAKSIKQICYIVAECSRVILSLEAYSALGMLTPLFPGVEEQVVLGCTEAAGSKTCTCPRRAGTANAPAKIPFAATTENRGKLEAWILEHYKASAFNTCDHQPLPMMHGEPMAILVDPAVNPRAVHKPVPVPLHWHEEVKQQLESDCRLGVIKRVPVGTPVTWCSPMVVVPKLDGSPRRTVVLQTLNDASVRQTHHTEFPFPLASRVPHNTKKPVLDTWNGYHSVALRPEDSHYTTFITPWGRFRYLAAPMGYLAAGDA